MAKATQNYRLFQLMKAGETISKELIAKELNVKLVSVPVYIHGLKKQFKAEIVSVYEGRKVVGYKLADKDINIPQFRKNSNEVTEKAPKKVKTPLVNEDGSVPVLDADAEITHVSEREFADVRESLGIDTFHGGE